jgi:pSer/pThr/pTyr-binding forkhead associated (FHA) protein
MAKLILSLEGSVIREIPLDKERITIGRRPQNDIQIENLAVSGEHACIVTILNDSFLEDLGSTNGTLVNGNPIKKHILQNNDVVEIGKYKMKYVVEATAAAGQTTQDDFERTMVMKSSPGKPTAPKPAAAATSPSTTAPRPAAAAAAQLTSPPRTAAPLTSPPRPAAPAAAAQKPAAAEAQPLAALQLLTGPNAGKEIDLVKNLTTLGKPGVQVAVITRRPQGYFITHVEGAVFPVLNGKAIDSQARQLNDHDVIELAGVKMEFFLKR